MPLIYSVDPSLSLEQRQAAESKIVHDFFARQAYQAHRFFQLQHRKQQQEAATADVTAPAGDENLEGQVKRLPELSELRFPVSKQQKQQQRLQEKAPGSEQPQSKYVSASQLFAQQQAREQDPERNAREAEQELRLQRERFEAAKKRFQNSNTKNEEIKDTKKTKRTSSKKKRHSSHQNSRIIIVTDCKNEEYLKNRKMKKIEAMEKKKKNEQEQQEHQNDNDDQQQQRQSLASVVDAGSYGSFTADPIATRINTTASNSTTTCTESASPTNNAGSSTNVYNNGDDQEGGEHDNDDDDALPDDMEKQYSISPTIAEPSQGRNQQQGFPIGSQQQQQQQQQRQPSQPQVQQPQNGMEEHRTDTDDFDWTERIKTKKGSNLTPSDPISPVPPEQ